GRGGGCRDNGGWWGGAGFFFSSRRRHTRFDCDWSSDVCSSDLSAEVGAVAIATGAAATANAFNRSAISETANGTGAIALSVTNRSEERRVGKECRSRGSRGH